MKLACTFFTMLIAFLRNGEAAAPRATRTRSRLPRPEAEFSAICVHSTFEDAEEFDWESEIDRYPEHATPRET